MRRLAITCLVCAVLTAPHVQAAPGAHGPNGEHLDMPVSGVSAAAAGPRFETQSEGFELVGRLHGGELSMLVNRFDTSEPVLGAEVEVQLGGLKARAPFHVDAGDYAVDDETLLRALRQPGEHALVITVLAAGGGDLLDATLRVEQAGPAAQGHEGSGWARHVRSGAWVAGVLLLLGGAAAWIERGRRARRRSPVGEAAR